MTTSVPVESNSFAVVCVAVLSALVALATYSSTAHTPPFSDEVAYFSESIWIAEHGGFSGFLQACLSGDYPFYTRNPGLPLLMSTVAERSLEMVRPARLFQVLLSWGALVAMFAVARKSIGDAWAAVWALGIAASYPWLSSAATLTVEPVFFSLAFIAWYWMCVREWREDSRATHWLVTGVILGVAYWFKASVLLLGATVFVSVPVYVVVNMRKRPTTDDVRMIATACALVISGFVFVTWPLLLERFVAKGNPFFLDSAAAMWMDHWEQHHIMFQGLAEFSLSQWFATHTFEQAWQRLASGLVSQLAIASAFFSPQEKPGWIGRVFGVFVLALSLRGGWLLRHPFARFHTLCFCALSIGSLSWNIHTQTPRLSGFLAPILGYLAVLAVRDGVEKSGRRMAVPFAHSAWRPVGVSLASLYLAGVLVGGAHLSNQWPPSPRDSLRVSPSYASLGQWMVEHVIKPGATVFQTPYLYPDLQLHWLLGHEDLFVNIPLFEEFRQVDAYANKRGARYLVIARGTSLDLRRQIFAPYAQGELDAMKFDLPGWRKVAEDPSEGRAWVIFESQLEAAKQRRLSEPAAGNSVAGHFPAEPALELVEGTLRE